MCRAVDGAVVSPEHGVGQQPVVGRRCASSSLLTHSNDFFRQHKTKQMLELFLPLPIFTILTKCDKHEGPASYLDPTFDEEYIFDVFEMNWKPYDTQNVKLKLLLLKQQ